MGTLQREGQHPLRTLYERVPGKACGRRWTCGSASTPNRTRMPCSASPWRCGFAGGLGVLLVAASGYWIARLGWPRCALSDEARSLSPQRLSQRLAHGRCRRNWAT
jgi:two-component system heavy metal sensor histidine kinase CusS